MNMNGETSEKQRRVDEMVKHMNETKLLKQRKVDPNLVQYIRMDYDEAKKLYDQYKEENKGREEAMNRAIKNRIKNDDDLWHYGFSVKRLRTMEPAKNPNDPEMCICSRQIKATRYWHSGHKMEQLQVEQNNGYDYSKKKIYCHMC